MLNPTLRIAQHQQKRIRHLRSQCDSYKFFNLLTSDLLLDKVEDLLPMHRERLFHPTETLSMFLAQAMNDDNSCQKIVNDNAVKRINSGLSVCSINTGGYCRARQRLPLELVRSLTQTLGTLVDGESPESWKWKGRNVKIVDGTTVTMPDTLANQRSYPQQQRQKPGLGFPICRLVGITSLSSGMLLNAAIGRFNGKGGDERALLRSLQGSFSEGDIVLGDALFPTYFFIAQMQQQGVDILMEQHGSRRLKTDFRLGLKVGVRDHLIEIPKPKKCPDWMEKSAYEAAPEFLVLREFKANKKIMVTSLLCPKVASKSELASLYKSRWQVELDIRNIKDTLGMNILSCKSPEMAVKEIWVHLLAYNLIRLLMAQSASMFDRLPRQLSFKHCLQIWVAGLKYLSDIDVDTQNELLKLMAQRQIGKRPGRLEPRAVKRRPKPFPLLMKPRSLARMEVEKNGHPKKLK